MLFGGGGAKPAEGGGDKKDGGGFNMGNMMEGLKKANEIGQKTKDLQKVNMFDDRVMNIEGATWDDDGILALIAPSFSGVTLISHESAAAGKTCRDSLARWCKALAFMGPVHLEMQPRSCDDLL